MCSLRHEYLGAFAVTIHFRSSQGFRILIVRLICMTMRQESDTVFPSMLAYAARKWMAVVG